MVRTRTKRKASSDAASDAEAQTSAKRASPAPLDELQRLKLEAWLDEFDLEVKSRTRALRTQAEDEVLVLRRELDIQLMKFPKRIRQMTVAEFEREHGGDWLLASARKAPEHASTLSDGAQPAAQYADSAVPATPRAPHSASCASAPTPLSARSQQKRAELTQRFKSSRRAPLGALPQPNAALDAARLARGKAVQDSTRQQLAMLSSQLQSLMATLGK